MDNMGERALEAKHLRMIVSQDTRLAMPPLPVPEGPLSAPEGLEVDAAAESLADKEMVIVTTKAIFAVGARVRLTNREIPTDLHGLTGTLLMKTKKGKWWVKLDTNSKDELVDAAQLQIFDEELERFLQDARPDWTPRDIACVTERLVKVHIMSAKDLRKHLVGKGNVSLNEVLKLAGEKCFTADTVRALRRRAKEA